MKAGTRVRRNPRVVFRELSGDGGGAVLVHLDTGAYHGLNAVGMVLWELLAEARTVAELEAWLAERVTDVPDTAGADLAAFVADLHARDLVRLDG